METLPSCSTHGLEIIAMLKTVTDLRTLVHPAKALGGALYMAYGRESNWPRSAVAALGIAEATGVRDE